jgi:NADH:ubiquinone reductase (H+-translocating)
MKKVVILGGGFAGLSAALNLEKKLAGHEFSITIIDSHDYHLFNSNLYEVATAAEEMESMGDLKESIALPYNKIFKNKKISFIKGEILEVNTHEKQAILAGRKVIYDYLVIAQGSKEEFFNIPGAKEFGIPLKNLGQALKIKNAIEFAIEAHKYDTHKPYVKIVVAGGGYTGVELAGELRGLVNFLAWKQGYPVEKVLIDVVEASNLLMPGMGEQATSDAKARLQDLWVTVRLLSPITKVEHNSLELANGEKMIYDVLIWTAGVKARPVPKGLELETDKRGRVVVDEFLRAKGNYNIFMLGDQASVLSSNGQAVPQSAQDAISQGKYLGKILPEVLRNKTVQAYFPKPHGFIVSIGGKWAILNYPPFYFTGRLAYFVHELATWRYFASLIGWWKAAKFVWFQMDLYGRND